MLTSRRFFPGGLPANRASFVGSNHDPGLLPTSPRANRELFEDSADDATAIALYVPTGILAKLETGSPYYEVTDVETSMKHAANIFEGNHLVFRDKWGRVFLQETRFHGPQFSKKSHRQKRYLQIPLVGE